MSEYFQVLKRLQAERIGLAPYRLRPGSVTPTPGAAPTEAATREPQVMRAARAAPPVSRAYATLYDNLRAKANGHPTRALVFAGAADADPVRIVTEGLAAHVRRISLRVLVAELLESNGRPLLRPRAAACDPLATAPESIPLDLRSHAVSVEVQRWLADCAGAAELVIIESTALTESIDSALLGCACDGLVLVAQTEVTPRESLAVAVERAQAVGCNPLGIVMYGTHTRLPAWARQLLPRSRRQPIAPEEE